MTALLLRLFKIPAEPHAPDGSPDSIRIFRAGRNYYRWRLIRWAFLHSLALLPFLVLFIASFQMKPSPRKVFYVLSIIGLTSMAVTAPFSFLTQKLNYDLRWYIVTDRSLRIRSGIWSVQEITMTFANIQDIKLNSDPLQLLLGLADLEVSSAGGGATAGPHGHVPNPHTARFAGVDNAEQLRDLIADRLRHYRDAGLGDREPQQKPASVNEAAAELLAAAKSLHATVQQVR